MKRSVPSTLYFIAWILTLLYFVEHPTLQISNITTLIWETGTIVIFIINVFSFRSIIRKYAVAFMLTILILSFGVLQYGVLADVHKIFAVFAYVNFLLCLIQSDIHAREIGDDIKYIKYFSAFLALLFILYSQTIIANKVTDSSGIWFSKYFVFNLSNSNIAAFYLSCIFYLLLLNLFEFKHKKVIYLIMAGVLYCIWGTKARMTILSTILVLALWIVYRRRKIRKWLVYICALTPVVFPFVYLQLFNSGLHNIVIGDKTLFSGRQYVFASYLAALDSPIRWLFGNMGVQTFSNGHNGAISIITTIGLVGFGCFYYILISKIKTATEYELSDRGKMALLSIIGILIQSASEGTMFLGGFPGITFLFTFFYYLALDCQETTYLRRCFGEKS